MYFTTCSDCQFEISAAPNEFEAFADNAELHEAFNKNHTVTVWDGPTSQLPRSFWFNRPIGRTSNV